MTRARHIVREARRRKGPSLTAKRRASRSAQAQWTDFELETQRKFLVRKLHVDSNGLVRPHTRTDRLAAEMRYGHVRSARQTLRLGLSVEPIERVKHALREVGSPRVYEGPWHAQLRLVAASVARLIAPTGAELSFEEAAIAGYRIDLLLRDAAGAPLLGMECGVTAGNAVYEHLAAGIPRLVVLPFDHAAWARGDVTAWTFAFSDRPPLFMPQSDAIRAAYAALFSTDVTAEQVCSQTQSWKGDANASAL